LTTNQIAERLIIHRNATQFSKKTCHLRGNDHGCVDHLQSKTIRSTSPQTAILFDGTHVITIGVRRFT